MVDEEVERGEGVWKEELERGEGERGSGKWREKGGRNIENVRSKRTSLGDIPERRFDEAPRGVVYNYIDATLELRKRKQKTRECG